MRIKQLFLSLTLGLGLTLALLWLLSGGAPSAHADSPHYVTPGGVCGGATPCHTTIQEAVDAAVPGDEILVATGTYTDVNVRPRSDFITTGVVTQVVYITKTVTIRGGYTTTNWSTPYPITQPTTLDAQGQGRVLYITGAPSASSGQAISPTIEGLRITGGNATGLGGALGYDAGGGVYVISATATVSNNRVFSNIAEYGGGLFLGYGDATLSGNTAFSNTATLYGGGLCLGYSDATLRGNTVFSNTAVSGGGLGLGYSEATLSGNTVFSNTATLHGGGLFLGDSPATFSDNAINGNTADAGGGLYLTGSDTTLSSNTISDNTADTGGGLYLTGSDTTLTNNVVADNQANSAGSGLYIQQSSPRLLHTTVARNSGGDGSGIYVSEVGGTYSTVALTNTILVSHTVGITVTGGNTVTVNGVLWYGTPVTVSQAATATVTVQDQHEGNPAFAADGYHLTGASAAIDRGVNARVTTDIDGDARPDGCSFDLGADEFMAGTACKRSYLPLIMRQYQ